MGVPLILLSCLGRRYLMISRLYWRDAKGMVRHGMVFHSVNSETNPCRTMPWARFRLDSPLGTLASNECSAELTSEFHR